MPITPFLNGRHFDAETKRIMGVAFEMARSALRLPLRDDQVLEVLAEKIIQLATAGESNPDLLLRECAERSAFRPKSQYADLLTRASLGFVGPIERAGFTQFLWVPSAE